MSLGYKNLIQLMQEPEVNSYSDFELLEHKINIFTEDSVWPNGLFIFDCPAELNSIVDQTINKSSLLFLTETDNACFNKKISNYNSVDIWYSMYLNLDEIKNVSSTNKLLIARVIQKKQLQFWKEKAELVFFRGHKMSEKIIDNLLTSKKFKFINFVFEKKNVGQALLYENYNSTGLYFFTIYEEFRNQKLGNLALEQLCLYVSNQGQKLFLLQSTRQAKNLYSKLGFQLEEKIIICKKNE